MAAISGSFSGFSINKSQGKIQRIFPLAGTRTSASTGMVTKFNISAADTRTSASTGMLTKFNISAGEISNKFSIVGKTTITTPIPILALPAGIEYLKTLNFINKFKISASDTTSMYSSSRKVPIQFWS